jgi:hypothetical protein
LNNWKKCCAPNCTQPISTVSAQPVKPARAHRPDSCRPHAQTAHCCPNHGCRRAPLFSSVDHAGHCFPRQHTPALTAPTCPCRPYPLVPMGCHRSQPLFCLLSPRSPASALLRATLRLAPMSHRRKRLKHLVRLLLESPSCARLKLPR